MALVTIDRHSAVAVLTLNRPEALNALSSALQRELAQAFAALDADEAVHALVLTGAGTRAFSAGLDLKELGENTDMLSAARTLETDAMLALMQVRKPVIAAVNGVAITGGFELALGCDILLASTTARFADTHVRVGVMPDWGLSQRLSRAIGLSRAKELSLSGNFIDAQTALAWGLVNHVVPPEALMETALRLAQDIAGADPAMVSRYKAVINEGFAQTFAEGLDLEHAVATACNGAKDPQEIAAQRQQTQARGRAQ